MDGSRVGVSVLVSFYFGLFNAFQLKSVFTLYIRHRSPSGLVRLIRIFGIILINPIQVLLIFGSDSVWFFLGSVRIRL